MNTSNNLNPDEGDLVYRYSRAQALADGVLGRVNTNCDGSHRM